MFHLFISWRPWSSDKVSKAVWLEDSSYESVFGRPSCISVVLRDPSYSDRSILVKEGMMKQKSADKHDMQRKHFEAAGLWCCFWLKVLMCRLSRCKQLVLATLPISFCFRKLKHDEVFDLWVFQHVAWMYFVISKNIKASVSLSGFHHIVPPEAPDDAKVQEKPPVLDVSKFAQNPKGRWFLQLFRVTSIGHLVSAHLPGRCERWRIHHDGRQVGWAILFGPAYVGDAVEVVHVHRFRNGWTVDAFGMFSWRRSDPTLPCRSIKLDCWQNKCV